MNILHGRKHSDNLPPQITHNNFLYKHHAEKIALTVGSYGFLPIKHSIFDLQGFISSLFRSIQMKVIFLHIFSAHSLAIL